MAGSLRQESGLPAEALAKVGGGGGSRTRVRKPYIFGSTCLSESINLI